MKITQRTLHPPWHSLLACEWAKERNRLSQHLNHLNYQIPLQNYYHAHHLAGLQKAPQFRITKLTILIFRRIRIVIVSRRFSTFCCAQVTLACISLCSPRRLIESLFRLDVFYATRVANEEELLTYVSYVIDVNVQSSWN